MTKLTYREQLRHPNWQRKRLEIMERDEFKCRMCGDNETTLNVHHKHYHKGHMPWEYEEWELVTLCEPCHENMHETNDAAKTIMAKLKIDGPASKGAALGLIAGWANQVCGYDLNEFYQESPYNFVLGDIAWSIDGSLTMDELMELRDALNAVDGGKRGDALRAMTASLKGGK